MRNGTVRISWSPPSVVCAASNTMYIINLTRTDGVPVDDGVESPATTNETRIMLFNLTFDQEYRMCIVASNADCSILSDTVCQVFVAVQDTGQY